MVFGTATMVAFYLWRRHKRSFANKSNVLNGWTELLLPEQALWSSIPSYLSHPTLPILTFANHMGGLGDPSTMMDIARRFKPRKSDVHIVTYPKAGTSWIQEVAWLVNHEADVESSNHLQSSQRTVYIELSSTNVDKLAQLAAAQGPRHIKWHHSAELLPTKVVSESRIIYLLRNPKDTVVSWYHFQRMNKLYGFTGNFDQFFELFLRGDVAYGSYMHNVVSWWKLRDRPNVLLLTYEEMHRDLPGVVQRVARFLGKVLSDDQVAVISNHCRFEQMRSNPMTDAAKMPKIAGEGEFMRQGQVGDWRNYFSEAQSKRMDEWILQYAGLDVLPFEFDM